MSAPLPHLPPATNPLPADLHSPDDGCGEWADELYREQLADLGEFIDPLKEPVGHNASRMLEEEEHEAVHGGGECRFCTTQCPHCCG